LRISKALTTVAIPITSIAIIVSTDMIITLDFPIVKGGRNGRPADEHMARVTGDLVRLHGAAGTVPTDARRSADPARDGQRGMVAMGGRV